MTGALGEALGREVGSEVVELRRVAGGDVNDAFRARLADGRDVFAKTRAGGPAGMFAAEAVGLRWLRAADALPLPEVLAVHDATAGAGPGGGVRFLALEWVEPGRPGPGHDERLGRGLAALHGAGAPAFGADADGFVGPLPQANAPCATWADFSVERRLRPLAREAADRGLLGPPVLDRFERLFARIDDLVGPPEPPARLHGDLWGGNLLTASDGRPWLVDPAAYGGHREVDLAMMRLFGGFGSRVFAAYEEAFPLAEGHEERVSLHQLYPLLVHVLLFGGGYVGGVERALARYT